jgi:hypothetical protein
MNVGISKPMLENSFQNHLGVPPLSKRAYLLQRLYSPFAQRGRAIRATSVASFYPSLA